MNGLQSVLLIVLIKASTSNKPQHNPEASFRSPKGRGIIDTDAVVRPVPFGHIYKEGFGDIGGLKAPLDFLELNVRHPMEPSEAKEILRTANPENIHFYDHFVRAKGYANPRDKFMKDLGIGDRLGPETNETQFRWYDLADLQARNVAGKPLPNGLRRRNNVQPMRDARVESRDHQRKPMNRKFFSPENDYELTDYNFTKCKEFSNIAYFHPNDVVDLDWIPFYIWSPSKLTTTVVHSFKYATKKLVQSVRELYRKFITIDWEQPKLVYHGVGKYLLVAVDRRGTFHALQLIDSPPAEVVESVPYIKLRIKIEEPYLVLIYCNDFFGAVMAVAGREPKTDEEKTNEASTVGIRGPGSPVSRDFKNEEIEARALRDEELRKKQAHAHEEPPKPLEK